MEDKCGNEGGKIIGAMFFKESDIKSWSPFKLKRKYGKFDRKVYYESVEDLPEERTFNTDFTDELQETKTNKGR